MSTSLPPDPEPTLGKAIRTLSFWAVLVVGTIALVQFAQQRRSNSVELSYTRFVNELDRGNVGSVEVTGSRRVHGQFKAPVTMDTRTSNEFVTTLPFEPSEAWVSELIKKSVDVRGAEERQSFGVVLLTFLPYLLIFGLIVFMLRQMKGRRRDG